jgi:hypothetical protein
MNSAPNKKKLYFNVIDVILIVAILASVAALIFFLRERRIVTDNGDKTAEIVYKIEVTAMREEFRNLVAVGDMVVDPVTVNSVGEVTDVSYAPYLYVGTDRTTGLQVTTTYPGKLIMTVTVKTVATVTDTGYEVGGRALTLGETMSFRVPDFAGSGICVAIEKTLAPRGMQ